MTKLPDNLISEIGKLTGYNVEGWSPKNYLSSAKAIDIGVPEAKLLIYICLIHRNRLIIEIKLLDVFDVYNGLESVSEKQIIEGENATNIDYVINVVNRMERLVLGKLLNQVNTIQSKLNHILNYR